MSWATIVDKCVEYFVLRLVWRYLNLIPYEKKNYEMTNFLNDRIHNWFVALTKKPNEKKPNRPKTPINFFFKVFIWDQFLSAPRWNLIW